MSGNVERFENKQGLLISGLLDVPNRFRSVEATTSDRVRTTDTTFFGRSSLYSRTVGNSSVFDPRPSQESLRHTRRLFEVPVITITSNTNDKLQVGT